MTAELCVINDQPALGSWNMAVDQALLEWVDEHSQPVLRWYQWAPATLSLGYFQRWSDRETHLSSRELTMVRRASGGGAIVHHLELTYSLVLPTQSRWSAAHRELYDQVHQSVIDEWQNWGVRSELYCHPEAGESGDSPADQKSEASPFLCFQRRAAGDLLLNGHKVGGSAQRRGRRSLLQHGSLLLAQSPFAPELPGVLELAGVTIEPTVLSERLTTRIAKILELSPVIWQLNAEIVDRARQIQNERFDNGAWTQKV